MELSFITTSGTLLSDDFCYWLGQAEYKHEGLQPAKFKTPKGEEIKPEKTMAAAYDLLREQWENVRVDIKDFDISTLRRRWVIPFLEILDYEPKFRKSDFVKTVGNDELRFKLSHEGWNGEFAPVFLSLPYSTDIDKSPGRGKKSPHKEIQDFLNLYDEYEWSFIITGDKIRILRDYHRTLTKNYVEFDLEGLFESGSVESFRALYRLMHASRFIPNVDAKTPLELFHQSSHETGIQVGKSLQIQVRHAIEELGRGFLELSPDLRDKLESDADLTWEYYSELLNIVYRLLFLFFVEQKGWLPMKNSLYAETYSVSALRDRALESTYAGNRHLDLWEGLKITFRIARDGKEFGENESVPAYGGELFENDRIALLLNCKIYNRHLLLAIENLTTFEYKHVRQRINFTNLQVDELGSVYESLLEFVPRVFSEEVTINGIIYPKGSFVLDNRGTERKSTGSYYTDKRLVAELIDSALRPVIESKKSTASTSGKSIEEALLSITVCDPACGSGAFLIAALETVAEELAIVRSDDEQPDEMALRRAKRDVLKNCIYGVDLNPMAVELCKVSLWIVAAMPDLPTNFLDHKIKCGNSLIGTTGLLVNGNIPESALKPVSGDDKEVSRLLKKQHKEELRTNQSSIRFGAPEVMKTEREADVYVSVSRMKEDTPRAVAEKRAAYRKIEEDVAHRLKQNLYNLWTAAFFWELGNGVPLPSTYEEFEEYKTNPRSISPDHQRISQRLAEEYKYFHWELEFPEIFGIDDPGFDCMLGNPPWERVKLQEKEWFATREQEIVKAPNKAAREKLILGLKDNNPALWLDFIKAKASAERQSKFVRNSGRFPLAGRGDVNTYPVFAEHFRSMFNSSGRAGIIVPTGIATDDTTKFFFADVIEKQNLVSLYDFENRKKIFPDIDSRMKFCLLTFAGESSISEFAFFLHDPDDLNDDQRVFKLTKEDFLRINPNTKTCPIFRTRKDADLTRKIYKKVPVLVNEEAEENPWGISFLRMLDMSNDSHLFRTCDQLEAEEFSPEGNRYVKSDEVYMPLYEAKMIWHYDHRFGTYEDFDESSGSTHLSTPSINQYRDPDYQVVPRYWVNEYEVLRRLAYPKDEETIEWFEQELEYEEQLKYLEDKSPKWFIGFRDITNSTNERTFISSILPRNGIGNKIPIFICSYENASMIACLSANISAIPFDFVTRQKIGATSMNFFYVRQFPVFTPEAYSPQDINFISSRVLELVYTASDLEPFAKDMGYEGLPFKWDDERRAVLKAELDAYYANLYGLTRDELRYILDPQDVMGDDFPGETFRVLKKNEMLRYGEYRTQRLVLEAWDKLGF